MTHARQRHHYGMVHGRFQPFHAGHLEYVLAALHRCDHLIIGITNPDPSLIIPEATDVDRHTPEANVFTFFERHQMIHAALIEAGIELKHISIVPFPIHHPERWRSYCPREAVHFLRLYSDWGKEKMRRLQQGGWALELLDPGAVKRISGSEVRRRLQAGQGWEELVPNAVVEVLQKSDALERLKRTGAGSGG